MFPRPTLHVKHPEKKIKNGHHLSIWKIKMCNRRGKSLNLMIFPSFVVTVWIEEESAEPGVDDEDVIEHSESFATTAVSLNEIGGFTSAGDTLEESVESVEGSGYLGIKVRGWGGGGIDDKSGGRAEDGSGGGGGIELGSGGGGGIEVGSGGWGGI